MNFEFNDWREDDGYYECLMNVVSYGGDEKCIKSSLRCRAVRNSLGNYIPCVRNFEGYGTLVEEDRPVDSLKMAKIIAEKLGQIYAYKQEIQHRNNLLLSVRDVIKKCSDSQIVLNVLSVSTITDDGIESNGYSIANDISGLFNLPHIDK